MVLVTEYLEAYNLLYPKHTHNDLSEILGLFITCLFLCFFTFFPFMSYFANNKTFFLEGWIALCVV